MSKLIKTSLLVFIVLIFPFCLCAGESKGASTGVSHTTRLQKVSNPKHKRMPSLDFIDCEYTDSGFTFYPSNYVGEIEVSVIGVDNTTNITEVISIENGYFVSTECLQGLFEINCIAENGVVYSGILEI